MKNATLHLLRSSPFEYQTSLILLSMITADDAIVLLDDGCYLNNHPALKAFSALTNNLYVIDHHINARALVRDELLQAIDLTQLNALIFSYKNSVTW